MSKALIILVGIVVCTFAASPFDQIKEIINKDECGVHAMETVKPRLQNKLEELKAVIIFLIPRTQVMLKLKLNFWP